MDNKTLRQNVIDELDFDPSFKAEHIGVAVESGVVTLTGHVTSYAEKLAAEKAVKRVKGVTAIAEEIEVRYPADKKTADDEIAKRAVAILAWYSGLPKERVHVRVEQGWITLSGEVDWYFQRQDAEKAVRKLNGIIGVANLINVKPTVQPADVKRRIEDALKRNAEFAADAIRVSVADGKVILAGQIKALRERKLALNAAWAAPGVKAVEDKLELA